MDLPAPERIVGTNAASDEAYAQLYMTDKIDFGGFALQLGSFEAAKEKNPNVRSWNAEGPVYGAPDGCMYQLALNNTKYPDLMFVLRMNYAHGPSGSRRPGLPGCDHPQVLPDFQLYLGAVGKCPATRYRQI